MTYRQIAADFAARIRRGDDAPGTRLPTYAETARLYDVSVSTVQRVYLRLEAQGLTRGVPGRGVFVAEDLAAVA